MSEFVCFVLKWIVTNFLFVGKKCCIFTENVFSTDFIFGNFLFKFHGTLHYFKIFIERKFKIKTLAQLVHICTSFPTNGPNIHSQ